MADEWWPQPGGGFQPEYDYIEWDPPGPPVPPACAGCGNPVGWAELQWRTVERVEAGTARVDVESVRPAWHRRCRRRAARSGFVAALREFRDGGTELVRAGIPLLVGVVEALSPVVVAVVGEGRELVERVEAAGLELVRVEAEAVHRRWRGLRTEGVGREAGRRVGVGIRAVVDRAAQVVEPGRPGRVGRAGRHVFHADQPPEVVAASEFERWWFEFGPEGFRVEPWRQQRIGAWFAPAGEAAAARPADAAEGDPADPAAGGQRGWRGWYGTGPAGRGDIDRDGKG
jgi:hypothetical protein